MHKWHCVAVGQPSGMLLCAWQSRGVALGDSRPIGRRVGPLTNSASELVKLRHAQVIEINSADSFFTELSEKVDSLADLARQRPLAGALDVATLKRYLADPKHRIQLQDLVAAESECLHKELSNLGR